MSTKMKGLLKGLRYISQIFEEEKKEEFEIGLPTDVKHLAHIGWDGPSVDSPSWMKEFKSPTGFQSAPLGPPGDPRENPEIKWVSEDSKGSRKENSSGRDLTEVPKSSRRHSSKEDSSDSPKKKDSSSRGKSRRHSKDSSEGSVKSNRQPQELGQGTDSSSRNLPDIPKKSRRKKSKESVSVGSTRSRLKGTSSNFSDPGSPSSEQNQTSSVKPVIEEDEDKKCSGGY
ncbi:CRIB domain-containing protein RIC6 [Abeliophyllum distichum]|uniref:CRIB domain-containing protein RIC6 n=1 Tax=Abeliophyllum distichum TaxID=126358 RepID=A0ABD1Q2Z1_9LAMI